MRSQTLLLRGRSNWKTGEEALQDLETGTKEQKEIYWDLKEIKQTSFEFANKPGKFLAGLLEKRKMKKWITTIRIDGEERKETTDIREIKRIFEVFYSKYQRKDVDINSIK